MNLPLTFNAEFADLDLGYSLMVPVINFTPAVRRQRKDGREYLVAPLVLLKEQVLHGSKGPLLYPRSEIARNASAWNGMPLVVGHPIENGKHISAHVPGVTKSIGIGHVDGARCDEDGTLRAEGWFDVKKTKRVNASILRNLEAGRAIELSTGLFTENEEAMPGATHRGVAYSHVARRHQPDHVAILLDQVGACSVRDGCGVLAPSANAAPTSFESAMRAINPTFNVLTSENPMGTNDYVDPSDVLLPPATCPCNVALNRLLRERATMNQEGDELLLTPDALAQRQAHRPHDDVDPSDVLVPPRTF